MCSAAEPTLPEPVPRSDALAGETGVGRPETQRLMGERHVTPASALREAVTLR